ncbi:MAG: hypothetical protein JO293_05755, partial [Candidatus Eremiobacteraeota bacterium]|nr:hypothetical protein [Candidatus Eremiobacteraeota bacterium]
MWQHAFDDRPLNTVASFSSAFANRRKRDPLNGSAEDGTAARKADHLRINIEDDVAAKGI